LRNAHADICIFVGAGSGLIENLCSILRCEELRGGDRGLQTALVDLIRESSADNEFVIKPQIISTLPVLVDFHPLRRVAFDQRRLYVVLSKFYFSFDYFLSKTLYYLWASVCIFKVLIIYSLFSPFIIYTSQTISN
jgi:hypothetical protein